METNNATQTQTTAADFCNGSLSDDQNRIWEETQTMTKTVQLTSIDGKLTTNIRPAFDGSVSWKQFQRARKALGGASNCDPRLASAREINCGANGYRYQIMTQADLKAELAK